MASAEHKEEYKHVDEDIELSDDEFHVRPKVTGSSADLKKLGSHLEIPRDGRGDADKDMDEALARGGEVVIAFRAVGKDEFSQSFPLGRECLFQ